MGEFIDGKIGEDALATLVVRYRAEVARATAAGLLAPVPRAGLATVRYDQKASDSAPGDGDDK